MSKIRIAAAGAGKTTALVNEVVDNPNKQFAVVTYTTNNVNSIRQKLYRSMPSNVVVYSWFSFLLRELIRPYQNYVFDRRIDNIFYTKGKSTSGISRDQVQLYYLNKQHWVYNDKISELALLCNKRSKGDVLKRLGKMFDRILIDEVQDLAGYDIDLLKLFLESKIEMTLVGDHRQAILSTNASPKNSGFRGQGLLDLFRSWEKNGLCSIDFDLNESYRCNQAICDLGNLIYPKSPPARSKNTIASGHDGVFIVPSEKVHEYNSKYSPQVLRYNKNSNCFGLTGLNFGEAKGLEFDRILLIPTKRIETMFTSGQMESDAKLYVAVTRARFSVGVVIDERSPLSMMQQYG